MREIGLILMSFNMDPFQTPNISQSFSVGTLDLHNMRVCNLSTIKRTGDVAVFDNEPTKVVGINISIGFDELQIFSDYKASSWMVTSVGKVKGRLPGVNIAFSVDLDFNTMTLELTGFKLSKNDEYMELSFYDNYESYLMNMFTSFVVTIFGDVIISVVEGPIREQIDAIVANINIALQQTLESMNE